MVYSYWREIAKPIIKKIIAEHGDDPGKLKRELFDAYPFGERKYHPYRIWLDEIKVQLGTKKPKVDPNQRKLF